MKKTRNTQKQDFVIDILTNAKHTMSVEAILKAMPIKVNKTTVYRILERFAEKGKVHFVTGEDGKAYYALCNDCNIKHEMHNHIHFQCKSCKKVTCLPYEIDVPELKNFEIQETQFLMIGICDMCIS
ncbi:Fur family ferric uptake transcriptional regulator [Aquimarina sp. EL_43]|uniref:Fur family transcriptional regulator n=1 Tax=Aquimarina TaxID=290174 RepID=UPI0004701252|nr:MULTISPECIES: transcriptional repressor [Aquimarina]MBG6132703.1 Fur family ferric uptake transcriptional regulator [Aquimarina sp. EL_35]MBG6152833.1 Fur family ferric uptake transcriptional regulator [Aquimarina sp. EL_32]MBG6170840.1 Fur family ferric uptake transcriptional regulator [Aquimarina sp. EL_43]